MSRNHLTGGHRLLGRSLRLLRSEPLNFSIIIGLSGLLGGLLVNDDSLLGMLFIFTSCVLLWTIRHTHGGKLVTLPEAYYSGSIPWLRFLLVMLPLVLMSLPLSLALFIYSGTIFSGSMQWQWDSILIVGLLGLLALGSIYLLVRFVLSLVVVSLPDTYPMQALRIGWRASQGRFAYLSKRLGLFLLYTTLLLAGVILMSNWLPEAMMAFVQSIVGYTLMAVFYSYLFLVYKEIV